MTQKPNELIRSMGLATAAMLVVSSVIGSGVFKKVAPMSAELQSPTLVLLCWLMAGIISLTGTLSNAEIGSMMADSGGEYVYFRKIYGKFFAFLYGWASFSVIRTASVASIAYVFAQSLDSLIHLPTLSANLSAIDILGLYPFQNFGVKIVAVGLVLGLTAFNIRGLKMGASLSNILTTAMIIVIVLVILLGLGLSNGSMSHFTEPPASMNPPAGGLLFGAMFGAALSAFWGYEGWANLGYIGGELKNPQRNLPLALTIGCLTIMTLYLGLNFVYLYALPIDEIVAIHNNQNGIAAVEVVKTFMGSWGGILVSCLILLTTFNCTSTTILTAPRISYSMAKDGLFFDAISYVHPTYATPSKALTLHGIWASVLVLSGTFDQLTDMLIYVSFMFYGATALAVFILRKRMPDAPRPYKVIGYPVVPAVFIVFCIILVVSTIFNRPTEALIGTGLVLMGIPLYWWKTQETIAKK